MARGSKYTAEIDITVEDLTVKALNAIIARLDKIGPAGKKAAAAFDMGNLDTLGKAAEGFIEKPLKKFADFEAQMDSVTAATFDLTKALDSSGVEAMNGKVAELSATARKLGADTKYSATEAAAGMDILAKNFSGADMEKAEAVIDAMPGVLDTAAATKESIELAADVSSATMNQFGLAAKDFGMIGDVLVKTANSSATGLADLGEALKYSGGTAHAANVDLETTLGMLGALGNAGKKGSVAGTGLASVLGNVQSGAKKQKSALAALGINIADKNGNLKPFVELLADLQKAADKKFGEGKGGVRRDRWLQGLVGMGNDKETLAILMKQAGTGELQTLIQANKDAEGTAKLVATAMSDNMAGAAGELDSALEELQLTMGETLGPIATDTLKWAKEAATDFAAWTKEHPDLTRALLSLTAALGVVVTGIKGVTFASEVMNTVSQAMKGHPIIAIVTGVALAAGLIYENWGPIKEFFGGIWDWIVDAIEPVMPIIQPIIDGAKILISAWEPIKDFFKGLWDGIVETFDSAMTGINEQIELAKKGYEDLLIMMMTDEQAKLYVELKEKKAQQDKEQKKQQDEKGAQISKDVAAWGNQAAAGLTDWWNRPAANMTEGQPENFSLADNWNAMAASGPAVNDAEPGQGQVASRIFDGKLMITVDSEGKVTKTSMSSDGDPNFAVRMNAGGQ